MSHGYGVQQRRLFDALEVKAQERFIEVVEESRGEFLDPAPSQLMADIDMSRARWRWYTIELLGLAGPDTTRAERVSLHRAINSLGNAGELEVRGLMPYGEPFTRIGFNPAELSRFNPRWPHRRGRVLWFRRPPPWDYAKARDSGSYPEELPEDDGADILDFLDVYWP